MITVRKLLSLAPALRLRKCSAIFHNAALAWPSDGAGLSSEFSSEPSSELSSGLLSGFSLELSYLKSVASVVRDAAELLSSGKAPAVSGGEGHESAVRYLVALCGSFESRPDRTACADICYGILAVLGAEPADWDFVRDEDGVMTLDASARRTWPVTLVLDRIRSPFNVGSIFRAADSFGVERIVLIEGTASPEHNRARRTSRGTGMTVAWSYMSEADALDMLKGADIPVVALEVGGTPVGEFDFPPAGYAIIGSEELGISPGILRAAGFRVGIPMAGSKGSLNVAVSAGIFLHRWFSRLSC